MNRVEELNERLYARSVPSNAPPMMFSPRPVPTKYVKQPVLDEHAPPRVPIQRPEKVRFLAGGGPGPLMGFSVDAESTLWGGNLFYALQKDPRAAYVPNSGSDLYNAPSLQSSSTPTPQPHPQLFSHVVASAPPVQKRPAEHLFNNVRLRNRV
jgi:hypothetical protein